MAKKVSWMWNKKRYYGTLIRETKTHKFARTSNGKIKKMQHQIVRELIRLKQLKDITIYSIINGGMICKEIILAVEC